MDMNCKRSSCEVAALRGKVIFLPRYDTTKSTKNYFLSLSIVVCHILTMVDADPTSDIANEIHGEKLQDMAISLHLSPSRLLLQKRTLRA